MKRKLFIFLAITVMLVCTLAVSVSADTLVPSDTNEYGTLSVVDGIPEPTVIDKNAKAVIVANEKYYTIPTYYLIADKSEFTWSVHANLQSALGLGSNARSYLIRVEIPEGIKTSYESSSGAKKFEDASKLIEASFPTSMELIGEYFFNRCYALTTVTGLENTKVTKIYRNTFNNTAITSVTMPSTVASIGDYAFSSTKITSIAIPDNVVTIGDHAFASCKSLATVTITENSKLKEFTGSFQFEQTAITSFYFPSTLESLGEVGTFYMCSSLVTLTNLENTKIETIPERAFGYGPAFTSISFPKGLKTIGTNAFNGHKISGDIILPNTVTTIGDHAFAGSNIQMGKLVLGGGLTTITGTYTFEKAKFSSVYIPATLTSLPQGAFNSTNGSGAVYYFTGSLSQLETLISNTNTSNNGNFLNAQIVTLDEFEQIADTAKKNYIVYGLNPCDTFYNGVDFVENATDCTQDGICSRVGCGRAFEGQESHNLVETLVFANGLTANGAYTCDCVNEGCVVVDILAGDEQGRDVVAPVFTAKGYSTNNDKNAINGGYSVDLDSLALYERLIGELEYGIVIANANSFGANSFFNAENKVNSEKALQVEIDSQYASFDCSINFGANTGMELDLVICAYVISGDSVVYIQASTGDDVTIGDTSFKSVTLAQVVALVPAVSKEN